MREVNRIVALEEKNQAMMQQLLQRVEQQEKLFHGQERKIDDLEKKIQDLERLTRQIKEDCDTVKEVLDKQDKAIEKNFEELVKKDNNLSRRIDNTNKEISYRYLKGLHPDQYKEALEEWYYQHTLKHLDLENPKTFNEKIQWLKLYDSTSKKTQLADKYLVREWLKEKTGEQYLFPLLGVWDKFDDIDFDSLPNQFVMKANHGSGWNIIVKDKDALNMEEAKWKFDNWMKKNFAFCNGLELHYKNIIPKIIAEQYCPCQYEYQFWCFSGVLKFVSVILAPHGENVKATYDLEWNRLDFVTSLPEFDKNIEQPVFFNEMVDLAKSISEDFVFVRVDFLCSETDFYIGEVTFTPASGLVKWYPDKYDYVIGNLLKNY